MRPRHAKRERTPLVIVALVSMLTSCASITFDLTDIEEPVMLSPVSTEAFPAKRLADFMTEATHATGGSSSAYSSSSTQIVENQAQVDTFQAIGGFPERWVQVDELEVWGGGANLLFVYAEMANVVIRGGAFETASAVAPADEAESPGASDE